MEPLYYHVKEWENKLKYHTLFILYLILFSASALGAEPVVVDQSFDLQLLGQYLMYVEDVDHQYKISDISNKTDEWKKIKGEKINFAYSSSSFWFRFKINNKSETPANLYLEVDYPLLAYVDFYVPDDSGGFQVFNTGIELPFEKRVITDRNFVFHITPSAGEHTFYLQIHSSSPLNFSITLMAENAYFNKTHRELPVLWIYYGLMLVMIIYNLFMYFSVKDIAYIYCLLFISSLALLLFHVNGFSFQYLWPHSGWWVQRNVFFMIFTTCITAVLYSRSFLETKKVTPYFDSLLKYSVVIPGIPLAFLIMITGIAVHYKIVILVWAVFTSLSLIILILKHLLVHDSRQAYFMFAGFSAFLGGGILYPLQAAGYVPSNFITIWGMQIGSAMMIILFSLGLADRINRMRQELEISEKKIRSQNLELENANLRLKSSNNELTSYQMELEKHRNHLEELVRKRTAELEKIHSELLESAHRAGMAQIASEVLHSIGNVLTSVKTSIHLMFQAAHSTNISGLIKANALLRENIYNLEAFILNNPKGKKLLEYYLTIEDEIILEYNTYQGHLTRLDEKVKVIEDVVSVQQNYANAVALTDKYDLAKIINDAITIQADALADQNIEVIKHFEDIPDVSIQKNKTIHILISLIQNAKESIIEERTGERSITISMYIEKNHVYIKIHDTGKGISPENTEKIFAHGFTTRKDQHGFGLHTSANYMAQMGGEIWAESQGDGRGATFILKFQVD